MSSDIFITYVYFIFKARTDPGSLRDQPTPGQTLGKGLRAHGARQQARRGAGLRHYSATGSPHRKIHPNLASVQ